MAKAYNDDVDRLRSVEYTHMQNGMCLEDCHEQGKEDRLFRML